MDINKEILVQMDSALRPEFDKAIDNTIERAFEEDVKTLGFVVANSIKCQWEVMKPHLFYAYCLGVKAQEAKAQAVPEGFVLMPKIPDVNIVKKICTEFILGEDLNGNPVGLEPCDAEDVLEIIVKALEPAND